MTSRSTPEPEGEQDYSNLRKPFQPTIEHLLRAERIKLRDAAKQAVELLEGEATPTREYLDYMWAGHVGMKALRTQMARLRERIAELESMQREAELQIE